MPTETKFMALGSGNGFPNCITKVNITESEGGTWARPEINELTLNQAMNLYWNLYGIVGTASATGTAGTATVSDVNIPDTPIKRVCGGSYSDFDNDNAGAPDFPDASQSIYINSSFISAMYDGDTSVESNFLGYSFSDIASFIASNTSNAVEKILFAGSAPNTSDSDAWTQLSSIYLGEPPVLTNVTFQGIPFIVASLDLGTTDVSATITDVELYTY